MRWKQGHTLERRFRNPAFGGGSFWEALSTDSVSQRALSGLYRIPNPTDSASGHKKARCDAHIGPGDGGNDNMAQ